jgi:hypothetical protein
MERGELDDLDGEGYTVLEALSHDRAPPKPSHATPHAFVCMGGVTFWVKAQAQHGLVAELIAGRLAARVGAGPGAMVIRVTEEALPEDGSVTHLIGILVGTRDVPRAVNARDLQELLGAGGSLPRGGVSAQHLARVRVFQTWVGVEDGQVMLELTNGHVHSVDHGGCFGNVNSFVDPTVVVTPIPGVEEDVGQDWSDLEHAVDDVESVTDEELVGAVAQVPIGQEWNSDPDRRLGIARWLADRRDRLRGVMRAWAKK